MTREKLLNTAIYVQYPLTYGTYKDYSMVSDKINKLPLPQKGEMFDEWLKNTNHYTSEYHIKYSIPLLCSLLDIKYDKCDFVLDERHHNEYNISILKPKKRI